MSKIGRDVLHDLVGRLDKNRNTKLEDNEAKFRGSIGNNNGVNGTREVVDALVTGDAYVYGFQLISTDADAVAKRLAKGDSWISRDDAMISEAARNQINSRSGASSDGRVSVAELGKALSMGGLAINANGIFTSNEMKTKGSGARQNPPALGGPQPPSINAHRPVPPPIAPPVAGRPQPPAIDPRRPEPPPIAPPHIPRYHWMPVMPVILPTERREIPHIQKPPLPSPARQVDLSEVTNDPLLLLAEQGRLRKRTKTLFVTGHYKLTASEAKSMLDQGATVYLGPDGGMHGKDAYQSISTKAQLEPFMPQARNQKLQQLQAAENQAYQNRVDQWREGDIQTRIANLPAFNSVYDTNRLSLMNFMVTEGGREFNRNLITALNVYSLDSTRREIATQWHNAGDMSTAAFNHMANGVITEKIGRLAWNDVFQGNWQTYLDTYPIPGLRYPDTPEDTRWNSRVIQEVARELPMLLGTSVLN